MTLIHRLRSIVRWMLNRQQVEQSMDDELQSFLEMAAADGVREGLSPDEARRRAALTLGGLEQTKERIRTERHGASLDAIVGDARYALRLFGKAPGFTFVVVLTLALGIGANTAIFSLIDALMLRSLPVRDPRALVQLYLDTPGERGAGGESFSYAIVRALADRQELFDGVAGFSGFGFEAAQSDAIARVPGALVTGGYYGALGLQPAAGRLLTPDDDQPGAPLVAVISDGYWTRRFARSASAIGEVVRLNGVPVAIVGVSPAGFVGANVGSVADITMAVAALPQISPGLAPLLGPGNFWLRILARPRPGISIREATARLNALWPQLADDLIASHWPAPRRKAMADSRFRLEAGATGWSHLRDRYQRPLLVLMTVVGIVLLIACANVASLLLARASARQREIAMRLAIGASRARIVRQLLIEGVMLSTAGAIGGSLVALVLGPVLVRMISNGPSPITFDLSPNLHVLAFTSTVAVATAMLFALAPALLATASGPAAVLEENARMSRGSRLLPSLVTVQVALSLVLLAGAGLFARTLQNLEDLDPGFAATGVLLVDLEGQRTTLAGELLDDLRGLPGVVSASVSTHTPLSGSTWSEPAVPAGQPVPDRDNSYFVAAGPGFFTTLQIPVLAGREFTDADTLNRPAVAIVNESFARRAFADRSPVGQHVTANVRNERRDLEIVGLVRNTHIAGLREAPPPTVYVAYAQLISDFPTTVSVRVNGPTGRMSTVIQQAVQAKLPGVLVDVHPLSAQVEATLAQEWLLATLAGGFAAVALALASVGLYGLLGYGVAQRTKEIGIRLALGAGRPQIVVLVLGGGARLLLGGLAIGLPLAWAGSRWVESMLFGLTPRDPATMAGAVIVLVVAAQSAAYLPARRASRVDSLAALRHD